MCEWLPDKYGKEDVARKRHKNLYDNDFSEGNSECCYGGGYIKAYCGRCFRIEDCMFKNGKLKCINCPTFIQFMSISGNYLFNDFIIKMWMLSGEARSLYPPDILENGNTTCGQDPPAKFKNWNRIKFVAGGSLFTMIRGECPKLSARIREIYLEQVEIED